MRDIVKVIQVYGVTPNDVAEKVYGWLPPKEYKSDDYRYKYLKDYLARASDDARDALLQEIYDKVIWHEEFHKAS